MESMACTAALNSDYEMPFNSSASCIGLSSNIKHQRPKVYVDKKAILLKHKKQHQQVASDLILGSKHVDANQGGVPYDADQSLHRTSDYEMSSDRSSSLSSNIKHSKVYTHEKAVFLKHKKQHQQVASDLVLGSKHVDANQGGVPYDADQSLHKTSDYEMSSDRSSSLSSNIKHSKVYTHEKAIVPLKLKKQHQKLASDLVLGLKSEDANQGCVPCDSDWLDRIKVQETMKLFWQTYKAFSSERSKAQQRGEFGGTQRIDSRAANYLKKNGKNINIEKRFGHVPGIVTGDRFHYRAELDMVGMHNKHISGIDYLDLNGKKFAISIVAAGRYDNVFRIPGVLIYTGQGGQNHPSKIEDQKLVRGNQAMVNSYEKGYPIRVIKSCKNTDAAVFEKDSAFIYDGLYIIKKYWQERAKNGKLVFKFELHRIPNQESFSRPSVGNLMCKERCVVDDISDGEETMPIRAVNLIDSEMPPCFTYLSSVAYPEWCKQLQYKGCICISDCTNSTPADCPCIRRNDGESPSIEKGTIPIMGMTLVVFECGANCKCSLSCRNRVSQHGPQYKLEIFKKETGQWGVRSRSYISAGSFVCEYVGKLQRSNKGITSKVEFMIDASKFGNVARFIRSSSSPNLFVQHIFYNKAIPHIALFAAKSIPPLQELTHQMDPIGDFQCRIVL